MSGNSPHIPVLLIKIEGSGIVTDLWEVQRVTQQTELGIMGTPFYLCHVNPFLEFLAVVTYYRTC